MWETPKPEGPEWFQSSTMFNSPFDASPSVSMLTRLLTRYREPLLPGSGFMTYGTQQLASSSHPGSICTGLARSLVTPTSEQPGDTLT
jgi:hypothetical protein